MAASSPPLAPTGRASDGQIAAAAAAAARCASIPSLADAEFQPPGASVAGSRSRPRASTAPLDDEPRGAAWREAVWATLASPRRSRSTDIGEMLADEGAAAPAPQPGRNYHYRSTSALTRSASGKLSRFKRSVSHLSPSTLNLFSPGSADAAPGTGSFYPRTSVVHSYRSNTGKGSAELRDCRENIVKGEEKRRKILGCTAWSLPV
ncbi:MAG: hypothetical protein BJ554DRAFT_2411 [Olpidium bornovanus]|uniref:Uncharacterized protein n=1 Tax=Olpidium bornovanus TaxID=278681 RepID=A0A8H8DLS7_9FUNG|nr:MAG: hypothetical protein BJ554DRAFT_2411 [Olpidium bornovanus]